MLGVGAVGFGLGEPFKYDHRLLEVGLGLFILAELGRDRRAFCMRRRGRAEARRGWGWFGTRCSRMTCDFSR